MTVVAPLLASVVACFSGTAPVFVVESSLFFFLLFLFRSVVLVGLALVLLVARGTRKRVLRTSGSDGPNKCVRLLFCLWLYPLFHLVRWTAEDATEPSQLIQCRAT